MLLFESMLVLLTIAIVLLQLTKTLNIPYPTILALAGIFIAASPWAPDFVLDPKLALVVFIAPALLDAGFDLPPRTLLRHWAPITALAGIAVLLTTVAVAWAGHAFMNLPWAIAIALGAIVAPPDKAAATAALARFELPRNSVTVLKSESLLNDAVALLIFSAAVSSIAQNRYCPAYQLGVLLSVPGGLIAGYGLGRLFLLMSPMLAARSVEPLPSLWRLSPSGSSPIGCIYQQSLLSWPTL